MRRLVVLRKGPSVVHSCQSNHPIPVVVVHSVRGILQLQHSSAPSCVDTFAHNAAEHFLILLSSTLNDLLRHCCFEPCAPFPAPALVHAMKRSLPAIEAVSPAAKRFASDTRSTPSSSSSSTTPSLRLRITALPPAFRTSTDANESKEQRDKRLRRETAGGRLRYRPKPHIVLRSESTDDFYDLIQALPTAQLVLADFTITTAATSGSTLCQSHTFDSQHALDEAIAALPLHIPLTVQGDVASFDHQHRVLDAVRITLTLTLGEMDESTVALLAASTVIPTSASSTPRSPAVVPRSAIVDEPSSKFATHFRLLPDLIIPLPARLVILDKNGINCISLVFEVAQHSSDLSPASSPFNLAAVLNYHLQRLSSSCASEYSNYPTPWQPLRDSRDNFSAFIALCPSVHIASVKLAYELGRSESVVIDVEVLSSTDMQLNGFQIVQPLLCFQLHSLLSGVQRSSIEGPAVAIYTVAGSDELTTLSTHVTIGKQNARDMVVRGDCLNVMRMADVLAAHGYEDNLHIEPTTRFSSRFSPLTNLSSTTALPWTFDSVLAQHVPWLMPCDVPGKSGLASADLRGSSQAECMYDLSTLSTSGTVTCRNVTLGFLHPSSSSTSSSSSSSSSTSSSTSPFAAILQLVNPPYLGQPRVGNYKRYQLQLSQLCNDTSATMSFAQLIRLVNLPIDVIPPALLHGLHISKLEVMLIGPGAASGGAVWMAGTAQCGPSKHDQVLFFNRIAPPAAISPNHSERKTNHQFNSPNNICSSVERWVRLQSRPLLNAAVFPQLAALTAGRCLDPLYEYMLCETEGGVLLSDHELRQFNEEWCTMSGHYLSHPLCALPLRPTNAIFALQPHLPNGYLELPPTALTALPTSANLTRPAATSASSSPSPQTSAVPSRLIVELTERSVELFRQCVDYLDTNSLLFGLLPAVHSLAAVTAALTNGAYGRRALLVRYGAWSDAALWSAELLSEWRRDGCRDSSIAHSCDVYWAAIHDLQSRINKYLVWAMQQRKEHVLPQLYHLPYASHSASAAAAPGTARPHFLTAPDAVMALLLCVPAFHSVCINDREHLASSTSVYSLASTVSSRSAVDFAGFVYTEDDVDEDSVWSLYMGPVYVYENERSAGRGYEVDMAELMQRRDESGAQLVDSSRVVRLMYIDDVNQLPVTRREECDGDVSLCAINTAACFKAMKLVQTIERTRAKWRRIVEQHVAVAAAADAHHRNIAASSDEQHVQQILGQAKQQRLHQGNNAQRQDYLDCEDDGGEADGLVLMSDRDGAHLEYVEQLMNELLLETAA